MASLKILLDVEETVHFHEWVQQEMKHRCLSQKELAEAAGIDASIISRLLAGRYKKPRITTKRAIMNVLGEPPETITPVPGTLDDPDRAYYKNRIFSLCEALRLISGDRTIEDALKSAIQRLIASKPEGDTTAHHDS